MLPSFYLKKSFDPILCVFQERLKRTQEGQRRKQETEKIGKKCCKGRSNQNKLSSLKLKPSPPFSPKRRRTSLKRALVQWRPSLAAILAQARSNAANLA